MNSPDSLDSPAAIARDVAAIGRLGAVPSMLKIVCQHTGMRFAAVARVTEGTWTACAVEDTINFGLKPGDPLKVETTLCSESRAACQPIVIDEASKDPVYRDHHTPRIYGIESYISVPIVLGNGHYFGNLCAIDPAPAKLKDPKVIAMFTSFAELIARQLEDDERRESTEIALLDARATAELREQFIAVLGHDLRSPLSAVSNAAAILKASPNPTQIARLSQIITSSTRRMTELIEDVLDFARGRLGTGIGANMRPIEALGPLLADVVEEAKRGAPGAEVVTNIEISRPIRGDSRRLQQLVSNLVVNALNYGEHDRPVRVTAKTVGDELEISVVNHGPSIPADHLPNLFKPYWRPTSSDRGGGVGLGLYICSEIVRAHGGMLDATSSNGETEFVARIPAGTP